ncbi:universal stress protein [Natronomonas salina]|uniref:universal stress protein n=1 Tax=Natronomonas salina TaxID=1710540 RepID=UPI0015B74402|nr:universal stress protein [Natronomonas salina]QLD89586.1 universal stress protein [Natronomonas salina]
MTNSNGTLLVPVANAETADHLVSQAVDIATDRGYDLSIVHVVTVPPQIPLSDGATQGDDAERSLLEQAKDVAEPTGLSVSATLWYDRDVASGILGAAAEEDPDLLLLGWRGRPSQRGVVLGTHLDEVLRDARPDVLVDRLRNGNTGTLDSILVPVTDSRHSQFAAAIAGTIGRQRDAKVTLLHVTSPSSPERNRDNADAVFEAAEDHLWSVGVERSAPVSENVPGTITNETTTHDLTVIGASEGNLLRRRLVGSVTDAVARHASGDVVIAHRQPATANAPDSPIE